MRLILLLVACVFVSNGCSSMHDCNCIPTEKQVKTLLEWKILADSEKEKRDKGTGNDSSDKSAGNNGDEKNDYTEKRKDPREEPLKSDRPDYTEASTTVGKGVIQFEGGYTYTHYSSAGNSLVSHSYPQSLFRVGLFADWFELRVGQNFAGVRSKDDLNSSSFGAEDTYFGVKMALTEQKKILPETAVIIQSTIPTGNQDFTADKPLPGINFLFGWDIIKDKLSFGGSFQANKVVNDSRNSYVELSQSLTVGYTLNEKLGAFTEWYAIYPSGDNSSTNNPQHYFDGGFTYRLTNNIQFDINAGIGLSNQADDYFIGSGIVLRF